MKKIIKTEVFVCDHCEQKLTGEIVTIASIISAGTGVYIKELQTFCNNECLQKYRLPGLKIGDNVYIDGYTWTGLILELSMNEAKVKYSTGAFTRWFFFNNLTKA